jgi:formylglycine-generating enzyme required for sulfatase activity
MEQALAAPHEVNRGVDLRTSTATMKAIEVRRADRFQTVEAFRAALKAGSAKRGGAQPPKPPQSPLAKYLLITVAVVGVVLLGWMIWPKDSGQGRSTKVEVATDSTTTPVSGASEAVSEPQTGSALISSSPAGADVFIDGQKQGQTPFTLNDLVVGEFAVTLKLNGYHDHTETLRIEAGKVTAFDHTLRPSRKPYEPEMVRVEGGTFTMGCTSEQGGDCYDDEKPTHQVTVSSFQIGKYEVTQAQWRAVMGNNPSHFSGCDNCPVENVSWNNVQDFIRKLNQQTGKRYRLPTEAEWEFAARGGNKSKGHKYSGGNNLNSVAWYDDNSGSKTHPVGQKQANELGIYDMSGNVWEWCEDWYGDYSSSPQTNPKGPSYGSRRVLRGGSWYSDAKYCRVSNRVSNYPGSRNDGRRLPPGSSLVL